MTTVNEDWSGTLANYTQIHATSATINTSELLGSAGNETGVYESATSWVGAQSSQLTVRLVAGATYYYSAGVRYTGSGGTLDGYRGSIGTGSADCYISRIDNGTGTDLTSGSTSAVALDQQFKLDGESGTTLNFIKVGTGTLLSTTDGTYTSGDPGVEIYNAGRIGDCIFNDTASSGATGTFASTLGSVAMAASGSVINSGTFASTLGRVAMAASGNVGSVPTGTFASTLGRVTMAASGAVVNPGTFASILGRVTMAASGAVVNPGAFASTLGRVTMAANGIVGDAVSGTFASTLGAPVMGFSGQVIAPNATGTFASTLGGVIAQFSGNVAGGGSTSRFRTQIGAGQ